MVMNDDERWMRMALAEARKAGDMGEVPIGAVVVCKGIVVGKGHNLTETLGDVTAHAEIQAITPDVGGEVSEGMHSLCDS